MLHHAALSLGRQGGRRLRLAHPHVRHVGVIVRRPQGDPVERRVSDRLPFPAEAVVVWNHDLDESHACRYRIIDAGDGGYRIHADAALPIDMTGVVLRILPDRGCSLEQAVQVAWTRSSLTDEGHEAGLRRL